MTNFETPTKRQRDDNIAADLSDCRPRVDNRKRRQLDARDFVQVPAKLARIDEQADDEPEKLLVVGAHGLDEPADDVFGEFVGRCSMSLHTSKFLITKEEINRRISGKERLNTSNIACNLRKSKIKNCGDTMRQELERAGLHLAAKSRQAAPQTKLISMCEAEVVNMVNDIAIVTQEDYPSAEIAKEVVEENRDELSVKKVDDFLATMQVLDSVFHAVIPPITGITASHSDDVALNHAMEEFSEVTHGMGIVSQKMWIEQLAEMGQAMRRQLDNDSRAK